MTATSLVPKSAAAAGIEFAELCERLVLAALRQPDSVPERADNQE